MIFLYIYLGIGFIYALYIWLFAGDPWTAIPINTIGGPINIIYQTVRAFLRRKIEMYDLFKGKRAVIFDLDGTIIDSQPFQNQAIDAVLEEIGAGWVSRDYDHGLNNLERWTHLLHTNPSINTKLSPEELENRSKSKYLELHAEVEALDGFWTLARYLKEKGFKLGLATNTDRDVTDVVLKRLGADQNVFDAIVAGDEVKKRKPSPEIYKKTLKLLGVRAKDTIVFEDTIVGSKASTGAGLATVIIWDGVDEDTENFPKNTYFFLPDFEGMPEAIEKSMKQQLEEVAKELEAKGTGATP
ncbi:hypothetical protein A2886_03385 [candidate division WWE3 bacterium RIFCSPHIGHO2_01_FULL_42_13]|uniref:FCP1 homology domain-containing protein n=1 Tax=candidate division WWE3 bacterium RIFCSPHIGHO2_01_FULL_42_13 TaxID=1802617 RepID=A0A1F4URK6_UNCKA|nr:MAG: hypothetical protein A2886_03385 [candidate division WWE3 bacterium RIFCSPHIGHO2_01_FULL_42_13]